MVVEGAVYSEGCFKAQFRRRTFHEPNLFELGPTQINKSTPVDSDVELNSPNLIQFEPKQIEM